MTNVISVDYGAGKHYKHTGFSSTISDSYAPPSTNPTGITWDGANVISADEYADRHYKHTGFSNTISDSYTSPSTYPMGITWDGTNVISADSNADKHYKHTGFSNTISDSYASPSTEPTGITWDGTNVISADSNADKHYKHTGFSNTISDSYTSPSTYPMGITWDGTNVISADSNADKHYKHTGFSNTISDSYASPSTEPTGITWDGRYYVTPKTSSDTGTGIDARSALTAAIVKSDNGAGADSISESLSSRLVSDTGVGVDALVELLKFIAKFSSDVGAGADARSSLLAEVIQSEIGTGVDRIISRFLSKNDLGAGLDARASLLAEVIQSEIGTGADSISESLSSRLVSDAGVGVDVRASLLAEVIQSEIGTGADRIISRFIGNYDIGVGIDAIVEIIDVLSEEGISIEFGNFKDDFERMVSRYGRTLLNHSSNERFKAVLNVLRSTRCLGDNRRMECGDALAYVLPTFKFHLGDVVSTVLGRGKYTIVAERYASRIGNLRVFRTLGLERYTPNTELEGVYDITLPVALNLESSYDVESKEIRSELVSKYNISKTPAQVIGERAVATGDMIDNYWNPWDDDDLMYYKVHRALNTGFTPSDANLVGVPTTNAFKHSNLAALTQYYFKVCAVTKAGASGTYSAQFTATTG